MDAKPSALWCALVIDREDVEAAAALARGFAAGLGLEVLRLTAKPYPKLGPHARIDLDLLGEPCADFEGLVAQLDRVCAAAGAGDSQGWSRGRDRPEEMEYERVLDARTDPLRPDWLLWLHVEAAPRPQP